MAEEIERKFIVKNESYKTLATSSKHIAQGYLSANPDATVRLRIADNDAFITVKSRDKGCCRGEWEYPIPANDAKEMMQRCGVNDVIVKTRYYVHSDDGHVWEIDEFGGRLKGLVIAEVELKTPDETFELPAFIGEEVTGDKRYYNSVLATLSYPF